MTAPMMTLLSPACRRLVRVEAHQPTSRQLIALGWREYAGPAQATAELDERGPGTGQQILGTRNGWIIPGTDPAVDELRFVRTGVRELGYGQGTADPL